MSNAVLESRLDRRSARRYSVAALMIPILFIFGTGPLRGLMMYAGDHWGEIVPRIAVVQRGFWETGELPRWNPYQFAGTPVLGNSQGSYYYPGAWPELLFPAPEAVEIVVLLHLVLAASGMYRLARALRLSRPASVIAGLSYALGGGAMARLQAGHYHYFITYGQAPWLLYALLRVFRNPTLVHGWALALWTFAVVVGGAPQWSYLLALVCVAAVSWQSAEKRQRGESWIRPAGMAVGFAFLGALLGAAELLPGIEVFQHSIRGVARASNASHKDWYGISPGDLIGLAMPRFPWTSEAAQWMADRYWHEKCLHIGVFSLLAAAFAPFHPKRGALKFFGILAAVSLAAGMSGHLPVNRLLGVVPGYSNFRIPARTAWLTVLSLPILAGLGWDALVCRHVTPSQSRKVLAVLGVLCLLVTAGLAHVWNAVPEAGLFSLWAALGIVVLAVVRREKAVAVASFLVLGAELCCVAGFSLQWRTRDAYVDPPWYDRSIGAARADYRVLDLTTFTASPTISGFRLLKGYSHPVLQSVADFYRQAWEGPGEFYYESLSDGARIGEVDVLRSLGVRWIVTTGPQAHHRDWKKVAEKMPYELYEDPGALPLAYFAEGKGTASAIRPSPNSIDVSVFSEAPGSIVISEAWMPGWEAHVDSLPVTVRKIWGALMSVPVAAGTSVVHLVYDPPVGRLGRWISIGAGLVLLLLYPARRLLGTHECPINSESRRGYVS